MSIYYDQFSLYTYGHTPYFHAHIPPDYPLNRVLQNCRAFRRLPPRLRELSTLAKRWATRVCPVTVEANSDWYDDDGYELEPGSGRRLTEKEIDDQWVRWQGGELD